MVSPWQAAGASAPAFFIGALLPMLAILLPPAGIRVPVTLIAVLVALAVSGWTSAWIGGSAPLRPTLRVVIGGTAALAATFVIGTLLGTSGVV